MSLEKFSEVLLTAAVDKPLSRRDLSALLADIGKDKRNSIVEQLLASDLLVKMRIQRPGFVQRNTLFFITPEGKELVRPVSPM